MGRERGQLLEHIAHDACGSSDGLAVYDKEGKIDGYCWACGTYVANPYEDGDTPKKKSGLVFKQKTQEEIMAEVSKIYNDFPVRDLTDRGIRMDIAAYFDVRSAVNPATMETTEHYYPLYKNNSLVAYKVRKVANKKFFSIGDTEGTELFGEYQARATGAKKLIITEGECDAMALYQCLTDQNKGTQWSEFRPSVVSIVRGADKHDGTKVLNELAEHQKFLNIFQEIILCFDQDEAGQISAEAVAAMYPGKAKIAKFSEKDANEMLRAGKGMELTRAVMFQAQVHKSSGVVTVKDIFEKARKKVKWGLPWPWRTMTRLTYGRRRGEIIGVGAGVGVGKTQFWHQLIDQVVNKDGEKAGLFMLEESNAKTLRGIAGKITGKDYNNPTVEYPQAELDNALSTLIDKVYLYDHKLDKTWESIRAEIRYMVLVEGIKDIILDPISNLTAHLSSSEANDALNSIFGEVASMAEALDFTLYYSSHLNLPDTGPPHEEGGRVKANQFTGSRAMIKNSNYIIGIERNTQAEDELLRNTSTIRLLKDRENGNTGFFNAFYDKENRTFLEPDYNNQTEDGEAKY